MCFPHSISLAFPLLFLSPALPLPPRLFPLSPLPSSHRLQKLKRKHILELTHDEKMTHNLNHTVISASMVLGTTSAWDKAGVKQAHRIGAHIVRWPFLATVFPIPSPLNLPALTMFSIIMPIRQS